MAILFHAMFFVHYQVVRRQRMSRGLSIVVISSAGSDSVDRYLGENQRFSSLEYLG